MEPVDRITQFIHLMVGVVLVVLVIQVVVGLIKLVF